MADTSGEMPDSECAAPAWERAPSRVTFEPKGEPKFTFTVPTRAVDLGMEEETKEDEAKKKNRHDHCPGGVSAACNHERLTK